MVKDLLLTPETYKVLQRVPIEWWNEQEVRNEVAGAVGESPTVVSKRLAYLRSVGLIERRTKHTIAPVTEIRRIART